MQGNSTQCCEARIDRKSTRLNSSHTVISYAVFCLKKKKTITKSDRITDTIDICYLTNQVPIMRTRSIHYLSTILADAV